MKKIIKEDHSSEVIFLEFDVTYRQETYIEEGHGYHDMIDEEEIDRKLTKAYIQLKSGEIIDITDRLTKEDKRKIVESNEHL